MLLSQFCIQLALHCVNHVVHDLVNAGIVKGLALILQQEANGVTLLAGLKVLALIYVKQGNLLKDLVLSLVSQFLDIAELDALVNQQGQVTTNSGILGQLSEAGLNLAGSLEQLIPVDIGIIYRLLDIGSLKQAASYKTQFCNCLARTQLVTQTAAVYGVVKLLNLQGILCGDPTDVPPNFSTFIFSLVKNFKL